MRDTLKKAFLCVSFSIIAIFLALHAFEMSTGEYLSATGVVTHKEYHPPQKGRLSSYVLEVKIGNLVGGCRVSREDYDRFAVGSKVRVKYFIGRFTYTVYISEVRRL